ncbi:MAG: hypothetical protein ACREP7_19035, partial [Lysobacter sp.]
MQPKPSSRSAAATATAFALSPDARRRYATRRGDVAVLRPATPIDPAIAAGLFDHPIDDDLDRVFAVGTYRDRLR